MRPYQGDRSLGIAQAAAAVCERRILGAASSAPTHGGGAHTQVRPYGATCVRLPPVAVAWEECYAFFWPGRAVAGGRATADLGSDGCLEEALLLQARARAGPAFATIPRENAADVPPSQRLTVRSDGWHGHR